MVGTVPGAEVSGPDPLVPASLVPYGLTPPERLLYPVWAHSRRGLTKRTIHLGDAEGSAKVTVTTWIGCEPFCTGTEPHGAGSDVTFTVGCDALPHCGSCECGSDHRYRLTGEMIAALKESLP